MEARNILEFTVGDRSRSTVLIVLGYYLPGYKAGGPVRTITNIVHALGTEFDFKIITSDRDIGDSAPYAGVEPNQWVSVGNAKVMYVRNGGPAAVLKWILATPHHVLYLNSFFSIPFSIVPMWAYATGILRTSSIILAPRGEFSSGALAISPRQKRAYVALTRNLPAYRRVLWHASSSHEMADIERTWGPFVPPKCAAPFAAQSSDSPKNMVGIIAPDLTSAGTDRRAFSSLLPRTPKLRGELRVVFLSRVCRMKNLTGALRLLGALRGRVTFDIYGPLEDPAYWRECQDLISLLPANIQVRYCGIVPYPNVRAVLREYDLFLLPTLGENYGHAIIDALLAGCPVLISDRTPWRDLERLNVGWDLPLDQPAISQEALQRCVDMSPEDHAALSARALAFGWQRSDDPQVLAQNRDLFLVAQARTYCKTAVDRPAANLI